MNEEVKVEETKEVVKQEKKEFSIGDLPKREFNLGDKVFFYTSDCFDVIEGHVVGFYLVFMREGKDGINETVYNYQCQYTKEMADGAFKDYYAVIAPDELKVKKDEVELVFAPIRKQRINDAIKKEEINVLGIGAEMKEAEEALVYVSNKKEKLIEKYKILCGEDYKPE
jgi:hypothetical protein